VLRSLSTCKQTCLLKIIFNVKMLTFPAAEKQKQKQKRNQKNGCQRLQYLCLFKR
uniref:Uncharacterized protein n=2 Tax=Ursus TaxID=9639 RepID=A0A452UYB6_URSMA